MPLAGKVALGGYALRESPGAESARCEATSRSDQCGLMRSTPTQGRRVFTVILLVGCAAAAAGSLWLRSGMPAWVIYGPHDDLLFVRLAQNLRTGLWLGPFDNLTLVKGVGFPLFMVASASLGIPLKLAEQSVYLGAVGLATWLVARLGGSWWSALALFVMLAFNPILWHPQLARVLREGLYVSLPLALVMLFAVVLWFRTSGSWPSLAAYAAILVSFGALIAFYWLTREEGVWIAPSLLVLLAGWGIDVWRERRHAARLRAVRHFFAAMTAALVGFATPVGIVSYQNLVHYGAFITNEVQSSSFTGAYGALVRVSHDEWQRWILFPRDAREKVYAVSEAARELRPAFEGPSGSAWRELGCQLTFGEPCPDILGGWLMYAFRDAAAAAGHYASARDALAFYDRVGSEISAACVDGRLSCHTPGPSIFPPFRVHYVADMALSLPAAWGVLTHLGDGVIGSGPADAPGNVVDLFAELVGPVSARTPATGPQLQIADAIARPYVAAMPLLTIFGGIGVLLTCIFRPRNPSQKHLLFLTLACGAAAVARAFLMGYFEVSIGPGVIFERYASPAMPFVIAFATLGTYLAAVTLSEKIVLKR